MGRRKSSAATLLSPAFLLAERSQRSLSPMGQTCCGTVEFSWTALGQALSVTSQRSSSGKKCLITQIPSFAYQAKAECHH